MTIRIQAYIHANDYFFDASFDATPWFEQASDEAIIELAEGGWTGSVAEKVARFVEDESVEVVIDYCLRKEAQGRPVGFGVEIHPGTALEWLRLHRPHLAEKLEDNK